MSHLQRVASQSGTIITPLLKKSNKDVSQLKSYKTVSNLPFLSKLPERAVHSQLQALLDANSALPAHQSAYRKHHSTETALIKICDDLLKVIDNGQMSALFARYNSRIWYSRSWTAIGMARTNFWCAGPSTRLVQIILNWAHILCDLRRSFVFHQAGDILHSTGLQHAVSRVWPTNLELFTTNNTQGGHTSGI